MEMARKFSRHERFISSPSTMFTTELIIALTTRLTDSLHTPPPSVTNGDLFVIGVAVAFYFNVVKYRSLTNYTVCWPASSMVQKLRGRGVRKSSCSIRPPHHGHDISIPCSRSLLTMKSPPYWFPPHLNACQVCCSAHRHRSSYCCLGVDTVGGACSEDC